MDENETEYELLDDNFLAHFSEKLKERQKALGYTNYELAKRYSKLKNLDSEYNQKILNYTSTVNRITTCPEKTTFQNLHYIITILGGSLAIVWLDE